MAEAISEVCVKTGNSTLRCDDGLRPRERQGKVGAWNQPCACPQASDKKRGTEFSYGAWTTCAKNHGAGIDVVDRAFRQMKAKSSPRHPLKIFEESEPRSLLESTRVYETSSKTNPTEANRSHGGRMVSTLKSTYPWWLFEKEPKLNPTEATGRTQSWPNGSVGATLARNRSLSDE